MFSGEIVRGGEIMVKCPLMLKTEMKPFGQPFAPRECAEADCAWWTENKCAIVVIAQAMRR